MVRSGGHRGHHAGHRRDRPGRGDVDARRPTFVGPLGVEVVAVETEQRGVAPEGGHGQGLVGESGVVVVLERLDLGDGPAEAIVDAEEVQAATFPRLA